MTNPAPIKTLDKVVLGNADGMSIQPPAPVQQVEQGFQTADLSNIVVQKGKNGSWTVSGQSSSGQTLSVELTPQGKGNWQVIASTNGTNTLASTTTAQAKKAEPKSNSGSDEELMLEKNSQGELVFTLEPNTSSLTLGNILLT